MRPAMRYRGSTCRPRSHQPMVDRGGGAAAASVMGSGLRLGDRVDLVDRRVGQHLLRARRPVDYDAIDPLGSAEPKVDAAIVLAGEAHPAIDDAPLTRARRLEHELGADRAAIASGAGERKADPVIRAIGMI